MIAAWICRDLGECWFKDRAFLSLFDLTDLTLCRCVGRWCYRAHQNRLWEGFTRHRFTLRWLQIDAFFTAIFRLMLTCGCLLKFRFWRLEWWQQSSVLEMINRLLLASLIDNRLVKLGYVLVNMVACCAYLGSILKTCIFCLQLCLQLKSERIIRVRQQFIAIFSKLSVKAQ